MKSIIGYANAISCLPGDTVGFCVSSTKSENFRVQLVRLVCGDLNPAGPGFKEGSVDNAANGVYPSLAQKVHSGSGVLVSKALQLAERSLTLGFNLKATLPVSGSLQTIFAFVGLNGDPGLRVLLDATGRLVAAIESKHGTSLSETASDPLIADVWYRLRLGLGSRGQVDVSAVAPGRVAPAIRLRLTGGPFGRATISMGSLIFPAAPREVKDPFNGRLDAPAILAGEYLDASDLEFKERRSNPKDVVAYWPFEPGGDNAIVPDASGQGYDGVAINMPTRAVLGADWDRETFDWPSAPGQYNAIHFHEDDVTDAAWVENVRATLREDMPSGIYALKVSAAGDEDYVPFFVRPATPSSKVVLLLPTATYLAYANTRRGFATAYSEACVGRTVCLTAGEVYLHDHPELGGSLYDVHRDGSGRHFSSYRRPVLNIRPKVTSWLGASGSALWALNADLHIIDWLSAMGIQVDIVTDHDLDREGETLLRPYDLVLTGTHPEYTSEKMFTALEAHVSTGGSILYLGGNGFYHRVEFDSAGSGTIEARRHDGPWKALVPERRFQASGRLGGEWSDLLRPAEDLFGVLCVAEGYERSSYYRRHPVSWSTPYNKLFKGVEEEIVGDFGLIGGGAAGLEVDRIVSGSTLDARVTLLASSEAHGTGFALLTDQLAPNIGVPDQIPTENSAIRADLVLVCHAGDGCVLSVGSMTWAASLSFNNYDNNVSNISRNAIGILSSCRGAARHFKE